MRLLSILACLIVLIPFRVSGQEIIRISTGEYPPYAGSSLQHNGFVNHVVSEAFKTEGYDVQFEYYPWKRSYVLAKRGSFHASSYWQCSRKHKEFFHCSDPILTEEWVFFYRKTKPMKDWESLDDLKEYRIGATGGYSYTPEFWEGSISGRLNIDVIHSDELNLKKLLMGRIDIFPISIGAGYGLLKKKFDPRDLQKLDYHPKLLLKTRGRILFPKKNGDSLTLLKIFNRGLETLKKDGKYDKMWKDLMDGNYVK